MFNTGKPAFQPADPCPASHPVRVPQVAYETMYDTSEFDGMWPDDGSQPFVWSYDDERGFGTHADYVRVAFLFLLILRVLGGLRALGVVENGCYKGCVKLTRVI